MGDGKDAVGDKIAPCVGAVLYRSKIIHFSMRLFTSSSILGWRGSQYLGFLDILFPDFQSLMLSGVPTLFELQVLVLVDHKRKSPKQRTKH